MLWVLLTLIGVLAPLIQGANDGLLAASSGTIVNLNKQLEVGDVITAYGVYADNTQKFSVNILGPDLVMLHVDFRPFHDVVVLNSKTTGWQTEIRPVLAGTSFEDGKIFEVKILVEENFYRVYFNGNELSKTFPHRHNKKLANQVALWQGSNGFQWTAVHVPASMAGPGIPFATSRGVINPVEGGLKVGDKISAWGVYATGSERFRFDLNTVDDDKMFTIGIRPPPKENQIWFNDWDAVNGWGDISKFDIEDDFVNGAVFRVDVECLEDSFEVSCNGKVVGRRPYSESKYDLSDVTAVQIHGGSEGMEWTDLALPADSNIGRSLLSSTSVASQSSTGWGGVAARAIDGNTNGYFPDGATCSCSSQSSNNWWAVTLGQVSKVNRVVIHGRTNCCNDRMNGAQVYAGDEYCGTVTYDFDGQSEFVVDCNGAVAGSIKIVQNYEYLTICEVQAFGEPTDETPLINLGEGMPTYQTSEGWSGDPARAVDGNTNGLWKQATCTHSGNTGSNFWQVKLFEKKEVSKVVIHNRRDCCQNRIDGAQVFVGNKLCGEVNWASGQHVYVVDCAGGPLRGDVVKVLQEGNYLTLCEVQILGRNLDLKNGLVNVAMDGKATQDSTGWSGVASRAIDGNTDGNYWSYSCSHNSRTSGGWWQVELDEPTNVKYVVIYNREDCCQDRINKATVYLDGQKCGTVNWKAGQTVYRVGCESGLGSVVRIEAKSGSYLTLCEVQVLADNSPDEESGLVNLALDKPTSQSSTGWGGVSSRAVDGRKNGVYNAGSCTHTATPSGWWQVDLGDNYRVEAVKIANRIDCCRSRIDGTEVYVGDELCGTIEYSGILNNYRVKCNGIVGSTVRLVNKNSYLTLCEVRVMGDPEPVEITDDSDDVEVIGDKSCTQDDCKSEAVCPAGYAPSACVVGTGGVGDKSDGAYLTGNTCFAVNSYKGNGVQAKATCSPSPQTENPCGGASLPRYINMRDYGPEVHLTCPAGYVEQSCILHCPWVGKIASKGVTDEGIKEGSTCSVTGCSDWCRLSIICKLFDDIDAYAANVCPTCEGYTCGEGEECVMKDSDDTDSDAQVPTCQVVQTGCDGNDRCGDNGACIPVGTNDYSCDCSEGYEYNRLTGTCLPIHTIWETVIGEEAIGDDAVSTAECQQGQSVMRCYTFGAPTAADGVTIEDHGSACVARASHARTYSIRAVAFCGGRNVMRDPCTGDDIYTTEYRVDTGLSPSISCPDGYIMSSCAFHSPWTQLLSAGVRAQISSISSVAQDAAGVCSLEGCLTQDNKYCKLTAICTKLTGDEYLAAACPTCDQVNCDDGLECTIGANDLPQCTEVILGGCEIDNCGKGDCIENGTQYTCVCEAGFSFDGATCVDVDECAQSPCGNGECENTEGSYECICMDGYALMMGICVDVDECLEDPCGAMERCSNVEGSYVCDCLETFYRNGDGDCVCADGYEADGNVCVDVDECLDDPCHGSEVCKNSIGNYECLPCPEGSAIFPDGNCTVYQACELTSAKDSYSGIRGNTIKVKLNGHSQSAIAKYTTISWTKDQQPWDPSVDASENLRGFTLYDFQPEDAGYYEASIYIMDPKNGNFMCQVGVPVTLTEGSAKMSIKNQENLATTLPAGKGVAVQCKVELTNLKLDNAKDPNNVNWIRMTPGQDDVIVEDDAAHNLNYKSGTYRLWFESPTAADSGTYKCEFNQQNVYAFVEVTLVWE